MSSRPRNLPADERRAVIVAAVIDLAAQQNPSEITTAAIAQQMGLVGLGVFVVTLFGFFAVGAQGMRAALRDATLAPVWLGAHGAVIGALMTGMVDHYFFNIDFHNSVMLFWIVFALAGLHRCRP